MNKYHGTGIFFGLLAIILGVLFFVYFAYKDGTFDIQPAVIFFFGALWGISILIAAGSLLVSKKKQV